MLPQHLADCHIEGYNGVDHYHPFFKKSMATALAIVKGFELTMFDLYRAHKPALQF